MVAFTFRPMEQREELAYVLIILVVPSLWAAISWGDSRAAGTPTRSLRMKTLEQGWGAAQWRELA